VPPSLPYHLADIYLEELEKALALSSTPTAAAPLSTLLEPFFSLAARTSAKMTVQRIESALMVPLFDAIDCQPAETDQEEGEDDERSRKRRRLATPDPEQGCVPEQEFSHILSSACLLDSKVEGTLSRAALKKSLLKRVFEMASDERTRDANRRKLYKFVKTRGDDADSD
jgi:ribosomal RNA-processing protein 1